MSLMPTFIIVVVIEISYRAPQKLQIPLSKCASLAFVVFPINSTTTLKILGMKD